MNIGHEPRHFGTSHYFLEPYDLKSLILHEYNAGAARLRVQPAMCRRNRNVYMFKIKPAHFQAYRQSCDPCNYAICVHPLKEKASAAAQPGQIGFPSEKDPEIAEIGAFSYACEKVRSGTTLKTRAQAVFLRDRRHGLAD